MKTNLSKIINKTKIFFGIKQKLPLLCVVNGKHVTKGSVLNDRNGKSFVVNELYQCELDGDTVSVLRDENLRGEFLPMCSWPEDNNSHKEMGIWDK